MLSPGAGTKIYLALDPVDMRRGFDGLAARVVDALKLVPFLGRTILVPRRERWTDEGPALGWPRA